MSPANNQYMADLNIIIPIHNEEKSITEFCSRLISVLEQEINTYYKLIFVNDHSTDSTVDEIKSALKISFPNEVFQRSRRRTKYGNIRFQKSDHAEIVGKIGPRGRATAILLGGEFTNAPITAIIDADLSYPPEAIVPMYKKTKKAGMVVSERISAKTDYFQKLKIGLHSLFVDKLMLGLKHDTQSALKVFKTEILQQLTTNHVGKWSIDIPLVKTALDLGYEVDSYDIEYQKRKHTRPTVSLTQKSAEVLWNAVKLKLAGHRIYQIKSKEKGTMVGAGIVHKGSKYVTHSHLPSGKSAIRVLERQQSIFILAVMGITALGLIINGKATLITIIAVLSIIYFVDILFSLYTLLKSLHFPPELSISDEKISALKDADLPVYSIMAPLYKEASVLPHFLESIEAMDYPKDKLDVMLLLEENDEETISKAKELDLPGYVRLLIVPHSLPKTKPKACNYGLNFAKGEYIVVYDAEDKPDPQQLKKSYIGFKTLGYKYACLQSKLNYYNTHQNLLTRLFTAEYSLWFDLILPGLQTIETAIPLGGTSNHFRTADLRRINGWDPFNVTEDCDLGVRLFKLGKKTAIIDSVTYEEANSKIGNWLRQRSRWIKGYFQTYFVHMRNPWEFVREHGIHAFIFQLVIGLRISFILINPILWAMTIAYFTLYPYVGPQIEALFPPVIFYIAVSSAVFGNFIYLYNYMIGAAKRGTWSVIKFVFLMPFYWLMTSLAATMAFYQLIVKPHYWEKTVHGLNLKKVNADMGTDEGVKKFVKFNLKQFGIGNLGKLRKFVKSGYFSGAFLIGASMLSNILNFLYNTYLGRRVSLEDFGLISLVGSFVYITSVPLGAITRAITHKSAFLFGKNGNPAVDFWKTQRGKIIKFSFILAILWSLLTIPLTEVFKSHTILPFIIFIPVWIFGFAGAVDSGFLTGNLMFTVGGVAALVEATGKLILSVLIVESGYSDWVYLSLPLSMFIAFLINYYFARRVKNYTQKLPDDNVSFPIKFFVSSVFEKLSVVAFLSLDLVIAKIFLSPEDAGKYALLSLAGKIVYIVGTLFSQFIIPLTSKEEGEGKNTASTFYKLLGVVSLSSTVGFIFMGVFGSFVAPILFGSKILSVTSYLLPYTLGISIQTIASSIVLYHQSKKRYLFSYLAFGFAVLQTVAMYALSRNIQSIVEVMLYCGSAFLIAVIIMHYIYDKLLVFISNLVDFLGLFGKYPQTDYKRNGHLRILVLNWRDTKHKWAGGAEVYVHELAKRWVKTGHKVTVFCGNDGDDPRNDIIDGVNIVRRGGLYTSYMWAFLYYIFRFRNSFDIIIDSENGIPYFSPLYSRVPVIGLVHHVHSEIILKELKLPLVKLPAALIAKILESKIMPYIYRNCQMVAVSPSTKADMERLGFGKSHPIEIISPGVDLDVMKPYPKSVRPTVLYLGRLMPYKSIDTLIKAFAKLNAKMATVELKIAGFGESRKPLEMLANRLGISKKVKFLGRVKEREKPKLLGSSWVFAYPSTMEGWGISIIEANACGTPVVASNVPGLRDSVKNPSSGYLVPKKDVDAFAEKIEFLIKDDKTRKAMEKESLRWASKFEWSNKALSYLGLIENTLASKELKIAYDKN